MSAGVPPFEVNVRPDRAIALVEPVGGLDLASARRLRADGWRLELIEGPPAVQRIFDVTGTRNRLPFRDGPAANLPGQAGEAWGH